eukprot:TRINITY_DN10384_c0_g1_i1.p1 TRINITY_DN10384_c0_g1~~TRINITY_DN10384_c0_g1_i1.p1  ORF type:complete len:419 (-),score=113.06 TRINITY_DN10384_c0_g1_i1:187-1443(-)
MAAVIARTVARAPRCATAVASRRFAGAAELKKTLLSDDHVADGGKIVDFAGYGMPVEYKKKGCPHSLSIIDSTKWTRESASLFDVSHMCTIRWTGKDAIKFVESVTTADIAGMSTNMGGLTVIPNERGGVIDDSMVSRCVTKEHGEHVWQVVNAGCAPKDIAHFEAQLGKFGGDVKMEILWDQSRGLYALQGPKAKDVVQRLCPEVDVKSIPFGLTFYSKMQGAEGTECVISRCGYTGEDGFEIYVPGDGAVSLWRKLRGEPEVRLAALGARDALRLEAGLCLYGHDLDEDTTPNEAGLTWVVGKARRAEGAAPFVGSETILAQIKDKSLYKKLRAGLMPSAGPPAREGAAIETPEGEVVGTVTSGSMSPVMRKNIAMGYINKPFNKKGTALQVVVRNKKYPALVTPMPFVPTKYYKP